MMEKLAFISAVLLLAAPAWGQQVIISCADLGGGVCSVSFDASDAEPNLVRAFALDITVDSGAKIIDINDNVNDDYYIHPGSIVITNGVVTSYGTAKADPNVFGDTLGLEPNSMTIEMASLYYPPDPGHANAPPATGILFTFTVDSDCNVAIAENSARGGVVMEDSSSPNVNPSGCAVACVTECLKKTHPDYAAWQTLGSNPCWCYQRQCRGDADGLKTGPFWVGIPDLEILRRCVNRMYPPIPPECICADFDQTKTGPFRIGIPDLNIIRLYINKPEASVPICPITYINFWTN